MTSTLCQSAALERIFASWTAKIVEFLHTIVKTILTIAEIVRTILHESGVCCRKAEQRLLALRPGLSWPMLPKLETMGRHARLLRHRIDLLPSSASALHADLDVSLSAEMREAWQVSSPQLLLDRSREEKLAEANGDDADSDDAEGKLMDLEEPDAHDTRRGRQTCPHVKFTCGFVNPLSATEH